ncbi:phosphotransferase [Janibacter anophelis]|uniref:phosphotransferase n=1 Tax=Janibacter anophelis TaxID=319054 RepID=UPI000A60D030|nr:phosphotransferase [Janibacter anophelis]
MTSRGPLSLAALASAAVPGLDPSSVEGVVGTEPARSYDVAFVQDHDHRRWVIRCPRTPAASARLEQSAALLALLARRLTMPVPAVKGWVALPEGGRAAVHQYLTGRMVDLSSIAPGSKLAAGLGRALAQLHNLDRRIYEEAGVPVYEAEAYRTRRLAELDRAAATGRVPTGLLTRWEHDLEDVALWRFTTTPTHGAVSSSTVLATPDDGEEPDIKAFLGWESAQVADPADDLAVLVAELDPESLDTVMEAYAHARVDRPDRHLQQRARLVHQMSLVRRMMSAVAAGDDDGAEELARDLRRLDDRLSREDDAKPAAARTVTPAAAWTNTSSGTPDDTTSGDTTPGDTTSGDTSGQADGAREGKPAAGTTEATSAEATATGTSDAASGGQTTEAPTGESAAAPDADEPGAAWRSDDTPVETGGQTTQPVPTRSAARPTTDTPDAAADSQDPAVEDPAVEVGDPGEPTPASAGSEPASESAGSADTVTPVSDSPRESRPESPSRPRTVVRRPAGDHETAEITPLVGDDGDDVVPPSPRR